MTSPEDRILSYPRLSAAKQQEVQDFVDAHPEWAPLLNDVKHLSWAGPVSPPDRDERSAAGDRLIAFYVTATYVEPERMWSQELRDAFRRLEHRAASNKRLAERIKTFRERIQRAESEVDPVAQFEALSSESLSSEVDSPEADSPPPSPPETSMTESSSSPDSTQVESPNAPASPAPSDPENETAEDASEPSGVLGWVARWPSEVQWAFAALFVAGCLAGALWGIDQLTRSPLDELAAVEASQTRIEGYRMDAMSSVADSDSVSADRLFLQALVKLREARTTTLGLFPRYDEEKLAEAQTLLQQAVEVAEPSSFVELESRFFLAKSYLAKEQLFEARGELQVLARRDSRRAAESVGLLQDLQRVAPIATPDSLASPYD